MNLSNITVIIRSVNENTEETCYRLLLEAGFSKKQIIIVHEYPFTKTLKKCFQLGIENNRDWLLCIDADVLPNPKTILSLCNSANDQPPNVAVVLAYVADRVFGSIRVAGNHLYRTCYLNKAINLIPKEGLEIRPETYLIKSLDKQGMKWILLPKIIGLHDFHQSKKDLFRKGFVHSFKHLNNSNKLLNYWRSLSKDSQEGLYISSGFIHGINTNKIPSIDVSKYDLNNSKFFKVINEIDSFDYDSISSNYISNQINKYIELNKVNSDNHLFHNIRYQNLFQTWYFRLIMLFKQKGIKDGLRFILKRVFYKVYLLI